MTEEYTPQSETKNKPDPGGELSLPQHHEKGTNGSRIKIAESLFGDSESGDNGIANYIKDLEGALSPELFQDVGLLCGSNKNKWGYFWLVSQHCGESSVRILVNNQDVYGDDMIKLELLTQIASEKGDYFLSVLLKAKHVFGDDLDKLIRFKNVLYTNGPQHVEILASAKSAYGENRDMFCIFVQVISEDNGLNKVIFLKRTKPVYGEDMREFERYVALARRPDTDFIALFSGLNRVAGNREAIRSLCKPLMQGS